MTEIESMFEMYEKERGFGPRLFYVSDIGFAIYHINDGECYLEDIFILPSARRGKNGTTFANNIVEIAKGRGCHILTGSVDASANGADISRKALESYGFKLFETAGDFERYAKEI
jgi:GNAT superfamily N-acetyltransferase